MSILPLVFLLVQAGSLQSAQPQWHIKAVGPTRMEVEVAFGEDVEEPASARLVPAPAGVLPEVEVVEGADLQVSFGPVAVAAGLEVVPLVVKCGETAGRGGRMKLGLRYELPERPSRAPNAMAEFVRARMYGERPRFPVDRPGCLIIVPDDFHDNVLPLARWKERKGFVVWVKKTSETGTTKEQIRDFIKSTYETWDPVPSYVILVGAVNKIPAFHYSVPQHVTDNPYACVDGDDYLPDLFVGRLPAANASELDVMVAKTVGYESSPFLEDTTWYRRVLAVGTSYQEGGTPAVTALVTKRVIRERMLVRGFTEVDTIFYPPTRYGRGPVDSVVNRGVSFVNGRGWGNYDGWGYPQYLSNDVNALANGWKLPVVTSIYCGTGNYARNPCFGEVWLRAGTPSSPKGGVAFWGASWTGTSTRWNNCMDYGIYRAILDLGVDVCGPGMYAGKLEQLENFPLAQDSFDLRCYFQVYNLLGDPSLAMWTGVPKRLSVLHPGTLVKGASAFETRVLDANSSPVQDAVVCLFAPGEVRVVGRTDAAGRVRLALPAFDADTLLVTVTGGNLAPYLGSVAVQSAGLFVGYESHAPARIRAGVETELPVTLRNFGQSGSATGVIARLRCRDTLAVVNDSVRSYGDLGPGQSHTAAAFRVSVAPSCTSGHSLPFSVAVTSADSLWESEFRVPVRGPTLRVGRHFAHTGSGFIEPGEEGELTVVLFNRGDEPASVVSGRLTSLNPDAVTVLDSLGGFGTVAPGESAANEADRFRVRVADGVGVGRKFTLRLVLSEAGGTAHYDDFSFTVGRVGSDAPLGPDRYGYYAYDDTDVRDAERPTYDWLEIDPAFGGPGAKLAIGNDQAVSVSLPFVFRFYGRAYDALRVSDNGYLAFDEHEHGEIYNWHIPSASGPDGLVAVFWDDFRADTLGASGIFSYHDHARNRFVVQWSRCVHVHGFRPPVPAEQQTFQVMLYDPAHHQTATGDGPIVLQYHTVQNDDSLYMNCHNFATVGIMNPVHDDGIEYTFAALYPAAAAEVLPGRAIRFTTNPPDTFTAVSERPMSAVGPRVELRPNPVRGGVVLVRTRGFEGRYRVRVYDGLGRLVPAQTERAAGSDEPVLLDVSALPSGVYVVRVDAGQGLQLSTKLLKLPRVAGGE